MVQRNIQRLFFQQGILWIARKGDAHEI